MITINDFHTFLYTRTPWQFGHSRIDAVVRFFLEDWNFAKNNKIMAIKRIRELTDCGLKEAKDLWELVDWSDKPIDHTVSNTVNNTTQPKTVSDKTSDRSIIANRLYYEINPMTVRKAVQIISLLEDNWQAWKIDRIEAIKAVKAATELELSHARDAVDLVYNQYDYTPRTATCNHTTEIQQLKYEIALQKTQVGHLVADLNRITGERNAYKQMVAEFMNR